MAEADEALELVVSRPAAEADVAEFIEIGRATLRFKPAAVCDILRARKDGSGNADRARIHCEPAFWQQSSPPDQAQVHFTRGKLTMISFKEQREAPLAGVRVVDVTHMLAGPYCTWVLGALGAEVIKIERPNVGDFTREIAPFTNDDSIYFLSVNRHKRSLTLNLKHERGKEIFRKIVMECDVLVENNRAGVMERLGLSYSQLADINPRLVYASISGFGQDGPYCHKAAFDVIAQAVSGMMSITGEPGGSPCRVGVSIGDIGASLFAAIGILAALQQRARTGKGAQLDVAMLDSQVALMENAFARFLNAGECPTALGSRHPLIAPFQAFPTADHPIAVCVDTDEQWKRLCIAMELQHLVGDPRFLTGSIRSENHRELEPLLTNVFRQRSRADWLECLDAADVPACAINSIPEAVEDPQVVHRRMIAEVPADSGRKFVSLPIKMPSSPLPPERSAPSLGEHTEEILSSIGFSAADIAQLRRDQVV